VIAPLRPDDPPAIGPYRLSGQLGCGGMGRVFLGLTADGLRVAVKVIRAELAADSEFRARFQQEVAAARKVSGTFTARVVDADLDGPVPWLATDYVAGPSLAQEVKGHGPLPVDKVLWLAVGLAESLIAIHAAGVVHRDLKPANVLLAQDGPRVIDFGISQAAAASATPGADFGSPRFMSPEHALAHVIGPPSDIFSLGAVLTFAATGAGPFGSGSSAALLYRLVNSPARLDSLPAGLRELVGGCLAKHPDDRPTASRLLAQVRAIQRQSCSVPVPTANTLTQGRQAADTTGSKAGWDLRHRVSRSLPLFVSGLLAAGFVAVYLLSGGFAFSPAGPAQAQAGTTATPSAAQAQPQAVGTVTVLAPAVHVTVTRIASPPARQNGFGSAFTTALTVPSSSGPLAPDDSPSSSTSSSSGSPSKSASPAPSKSSNGSPTSSSPSPSQSSSSSER
jgi:serine/threonine protein kinase